MPGAQTSSDPQASAVVSAWKPLVHPLFRAVWIASVASQIGTWVHDVGAAWLMTSLSPSPFMVSLVQAATALPLFLLAVPAGALADIVDRKRMLVWTQVWMLLSALGLTVWTALGLTDPGALLFFTGLLSVGAALAAPAWQATTPELVPQDELPLAVSLNGMAINLSRSIGPAIGGLLVGVSGPQSAFALNALSFVGVLIVLVSWKRNPRRTTLPAERFSNAVRAGLRYARHAPGFRSVLARAALFLLPASAVWALLPHYSKRELGLSALGYGVLIAAVGIGALLAAMGLPGLRAKISTRILTLGASLLVAGTIALLSQVGGAYLAWPTLLVLCMGWLVMLSCLNLGAQSTAAGWARARALAVFLFAFFGSLSLGSLGWGALAELLGVRSTLLVAAGVTALGAVPALFFPLATGSWPSLAPSIHWPVPDVLGPMDDEGGLVLVTVEYRVAPSDRAALLALLQRLRPSRLRDGSFGWNVFEDPRVPGRFTEVFYAESWLEHMRQHERVTLADRDIQDRIGDLQSQNGFPKVDHWLAPRTGP